ncbi:hypothetical protein [Thalassotalea profundi]|uniref:Uncharacterized protein n=1 Tax=Thalassotalea profundi TaxID=2036687 RepID=A0ABQ3IPT9_9GAMM|nr:hypothetical protein [Thalassotalea profundi]GHE87284.1 hypothetical protein GCM10011501_15870 [Thalassotalea profundi]
MNIFLISAGALSAIAAILHLACIYFGASWYRFLGAGEQMAQLAEQGSTKPAMITAGIFCVLSLWSLYAFSAAGIIVRLPFIKVVLLIITAIYLIRGVAGLFLMANPLGRTPEFWLWSSIICLVIGIVHLIGILQHWPYLTIK